MSASTWRAIGLAYGAFGDGSRERRLLGWECAACGLVVGGPPVAAPPPACPVCALRQGRVAGFEVRLSDVGRAP